MKKILVLLLTLVSIFTLISCSKPPTQIDTRANHVFFTTQKSNLHNRELKKAFEDYFKEKYTTIDVNTLADYEIYNYTPKRESNKYDLDIFQVAFCDGEGPYNNKNYFFAKHKDTLYPLTSPTAKTMAIANIAITDINRDGYIEILTSVARFGHNDLFDKPTLDCDLRVIDTKTEFFIKSFALDYDLYYFKENQDGVVCLYGTNDNLPTKDNVVDGKLDERFYDTTNECCSTPTLNTKKFNFKQLAIQESCDLFSVEVTIDDKQLSFPYSFERTQVTLTIKTKIITVIINPITPIINA